MANALAIASVTALLKNLLNNSLIDRNVDALFNFQVTAQPPDRISVDTNDGSINRLNIFLYRVTPNTGWANLNHPARSASGERVSNPYLAVDLHYMLSAYASEDLHAEILLGLGMQALHETPLFDRAAIRQALGAGGTILPPGFQQLAPAALADQFEQVRITPHHASMDEISKLWTSMNTPLRMSALYQVTVAIIESDASTRSALPVLRRDVFVRQLHGPNIARILSQGAADPQPSAARRIAQGVGDQLILEGSGLLGEVTAVAIGDLEAAPAEAAERRIRVAIPSGIRPGVTGVQVIHRIAKLPPSVEQMPGETSNVMAFVLHPTLAPVNPIAVVDSALEDDADPGGPMRGRIRLSFAHAVGSNQRAELLLNEIDPPNTRRAFAHTFRAVPLASPPPATVTQREFEFRQVEQAEYLVRARIDGAETIAGMTGGAFDSPSVEIAP